MKKILIKKWILMAFLFLCLFVLSGCKTEIWVNNDGSGRGVLSEIPTGLFTKSQLESELKSQGFQSVSVTEKGGKFHAVFTWKDFKVFGNRERNKDGSIYLDFGNTNDLEGISIVHVQGKIIDTTGNQTGRNTVEFRNLHYLTNATVTYKPKSGFPKAILWIAIIVAVIAVGYKFLTGKKTAPASAGTDESASKENKASYCSQCGAEISAGSAFCGKCGHPLK